MKEILYRQLALDYCCEASEVRDAGNHFSEFIPLDGRRRFEGGDDCFLKIAVINGKLLFTGNREMISRCREQWGQSGGEWFLEAKNLRKLNDQLHERGWQIDTFHPFFIAETLSETDPRPYEIIRYEREAIEGFRGDGRFSEAFAFRETAPDMVGIAALQDGKILGMAGASADSPAMWQIGINVEPAGRGKGIGTMLTALLKNEILLRGILPFYGTAVSHLVSQRVALSAGFYPAWIELFTCRTGQ